MPLTRLDNLISSKTGKYLYVSPDDFSKHCKKWVGDGANIVGGCCGVTLNHMKHLVKAFT